MSKMKEKGSVCMKVNGYDLGLRGHDIAENFSEMCEKATEFEIANLQFALAKTVSEVNFDEVGYDAKLARRIRQELDSRRLKVSVLGCYINPVDSNPDAQKRQLLRFENFIDYAKAFDATVIGTETGYIVTSDSPQRINLEKTHSEQTYQLFVKNMKPIVEKAERQGVTVGIEPVAVCPIRSVAVMKRLLDDIPSEHLAVILDMSNIITEENYVKQTAMIDEAFDVLGDKIKVIHVKDFVISGGVKDFAPAGTGLLEIGHIFDRASALAQRPEIILDMTPLYLYRQSVETLMKKLERNEV